MLELGISEQVNEWASDGVMEWVSQRVSKSVSETAHVTRNNQMSAIPTKD